MTKARTPRPRRTPVDRAARDSWSRRLSGTNINPETLLATDYLNHFNEAVMILDLVAEMPDCLDDIADWAPKSYEEHFAHGGFLHKALAIEAYAHAPAERRAALEAVVDDLNLIILCTIASLTVATPEDMQDNVRTTVAKAAAKLRQLIATASRIINGAELAPRGDTGWRRVPEQAMGQDAVDSLFD